MLFRLQSVENQSTHCILMYLFVSKNIYVIRNFNRVSIKNKEEIITSLSLRNKDIIFIFILDDFYSKNKFYTSLSKYALLVDTRTPFPNKIKEWTNYILKKKGIQIDSSFLEDLIKDQLYLKRD